MRHILIFILCLRLACAPAFADAADELHIGITQFPSTLNPNIDSMLAKTYVLGMAQRPLVGYDQGWQLQCILCVQLPSLEDGSARTETLPDGTQGVAVTYRLDPRARWGDGIPASTRDVLFTWQVGQNPESGVASLETYRRIQRVEVIDEHTFTLHMDRLTFDYASAGGFHLLPEHLEREIYEAAPTEYRNRTLYDRAPETPGLYLGPYRITDVVPGSHLVLLRNDHWWGQKPYFSRIVLRAIENTAALEANLLSGEIDYIAGELGLSLDQALAFERRHGTRFRVYYQPGLIYEHLDLNHQHPWLKDLRVRQALLYGADRAAMSEQLFAGKQAVADSSVNPLDWVYSDEVPHYSYDPVQAAALLDQAGLRLGSDGKRRDAEGRGQPLELMTTAGNRSRELVEQVLVSQWRELGLEVNIRNEPARVFFGDTVSRRRFGGLALFAWISAPESVPRSTLHSQEIPNEKNAWSGQNYGGYRDPRMDQLIDAIEVELDRERRRAMWAELQKRYAEELPALPLYFRSDAFVIPRWLEGVIPTGHQFPTSYRVEYWKRGADG
jgi:peptide/nickel transport system substrate-binding protein